MFKRTTLVGVSLAILATYLWHIQQYQWFFIFFVASFFSLFLALLESKQERIPKGMALIILGIFTGILIPEALIPDEQLKGILLHDFTEKMKIFKSLAVFVCSGAGGSIIANHAENFLSPTEAEAAKKNSLQLIDPSDKLQRIYNEVNQLKCYALTALITLAVILVIMISILLFR